MDVASELTVLVAFKLIVYSFGALVHLFLMVLILGQRGLRRLEWLLFMLMAALFMWNSGNLLALNVGLFYGVGPRILSGFSRGIPFLGLILSVPWVVHLHAEYASRFRPPTLLRKLLVAIFYLPLVGAPWLVGRVLGRLEWNPWVSLQPLARPLAAWLVAALLVGSAFNARLRYWTDDPRLARFHSWLAGLQTFLALGLAWTYVLRPTPVEGLGGYFATLLMLVAIVPSGLVAYSIFRYNFLGLRLQRNLIYSMVGIFALLLYINAIRRLSGFLEIHEILPAAATEAVMIFCLVIFLEPVKKLIDRALYAAFVSELEPVHKLSNEIQEYAKQVEDVKALQRFVEERAASELGLRRVILRLVGEGSALPRPRLLSGPYPQVRSSKQDEALGGQSKIQNPKPTISFPIRRGTEVLGYLEVVPSTAALSGDQYGSLQLLADQLAVALELCQLLADKVQLERALAEKAKMAFLGEMAARIAHNVKNPLSSMKTLVQLLEEDSSLPERARQDCRLVTAEIDRLNLNISQVLRYAKPARDTDRPVNLAGVVSQILNLTRADAERRQVKLELTSSSPCLVKGGEEAASDIISNLLVNALQASPPGGTVRILITGGRSAGDRVELFVEDQGPGIPPDLREKVFQPFFTTRPGGTGLGLAIVARRAEEIGSVVECVSPLDTKSGARFVVHFKKTVTSDE